MIQSIKFDISNIILCGAEIYILRKHANLLIFDYRFGNAFKLTKKEENHLEEEIFLFFNRLRPTARH